MQITNYELLAQVLDGNADKATRRMVMFNLTNPNFKECFMVALKATRLFEHKVDIYGTV